MSQNRKLFGRIGAGSLFVTRGRGWNGGAFVSLYLVLSVHEPSIHGPHGQRMPYQYIVWQSDDKNGWYPNGCKKVMYGNYLGSLERLS